MSDLVVPVKSTATAKLLYLIKAKVTSIQAWSYDVTMYLLPVYFRNSCLKICHIV